MATGEETVGEWQNDRLRWDPAREPGAAAEIQHSVGAAAAVVGRPTGRLIYGDGAVYWGELRDGGVDGELIREGSGQLILPDERQIRRGVWEGDRLAQQAPPVEDAGRWDAVAGSDQAEVSWRLQNLRERKPPAGPVLVAAVAAGATPSWPAAAPPAWPEDAPPAPGDSWPEKDAHGMHVDRCRRFRPGRHWPEHNGPSEGRRCPSSAAGVRNAMRAVRPPGPQSIRDPDGGCPFCTSSAYDLDGDSRAAGDNRGKRAAGTWDENGPLERCSQCFPLAAVQTQAVVAAAAPVSALAAAAVSMIETPHMSLKAATVAAAVAALVQPKQPGTAAGALAVPDPAAPEPPPARSGSEPLRAITLLSGLSLEQMASIGAALMTGAADGGSGEEQLPTAQLAAQLELAVA